jgi:hypothetical protein
MIESVCSHNVLVIGYFYLGFICFLYFGFRIFVYQAVVLEL